MPCMERLVILLLSLAALANLCHGQACGFECAARMTSVETCGGSGWEWRREIYVYAGPITDEQILNEAWSENPEPSEMMMDRIGSIYSDVVDGEIVNLHQSWTGQSPWSPRQTQEYFWTLLDPVCIYDKKSIIESRLFLRKKGPELDQTCSQGPEEYIYKSLSLFEADMNAGRNPPEEIVANNGIVFGPALPRVEIGCAVYSVAEPPPVVTPSPPPPPDVCEGNRGVRPNADPISNQDWDCYERGVLALQENGVWQRFVDIHADHGAHGGALFLVWHRAMLWEFEKELNAVEPGCKIPAYDSAADNTGVFNPGQSQVFTNNRAGQCDTLGPFSGIPGLTRDCPSDEFISDTTAMNNAITGVGSAATGTETDTSFSATYDEFNRYIEGVHGNFHVAVGGSMAIPATASRDPVFYMHHAYIDKVWRQWQNTRGRNDFGGERIFGQGDFVDTSVVMEPWSMTAGDVINRISGCIEYENENGGPVLRMEMPTAARQGKSEGVRRDGKGTLDSDAPADLPVVEEKIKDSYQLQVAKEKIASPKVYERRVLIAKRMNQACVDSLRTLGVYSEIFIESWQRLEGFRLLALERIDLADVEVAEEAENSGNTDAIVAQGEAEKDAIENNGDLAAVNPKKVDEEPTYAIVTVP